MKGSPKKSPPPGASQKWEVPEASAIDPTDDPWRSPGQTEPLQRGIGQVDNTHPLSCRFCGVALSAYEAWARDGDIYCLACRPQGAVSSPEPPPDVLLHQQIERGDPIRWLGYLLRRLLSLFRGVK